MLGRLWTSSSVATVFHFVVAATSFSSSSSVLLAKSPPTTGGGDDDEALWLDLFGRIITLSDGDDGGGEDVDLAPWPSLPANQTKKKTGVLERVRRHEQAQRAAATVAKTTATATITVPKTTTLQKQGQ